MTEVPANLEEVRARIHRACEACGRSVEEVTLVAVSKKKGAELIREAFDAGQLIFGENRVQEVMAKQPELPSALQWHLIGHLQSNKVKHAVHCEFDCIHSVDSAKLLRKLNEESDQQGRVQTVFLQVNVSGEASKFGLAPEEMAPLLEQATGFHSINIQGLMTIPPFTEDPEKAAPHFARLRELRDELRGSTGFDLPELSMGMSHDLEVAIREGATLVRVGTDIFGARTL
jgi:pyridoxal phosphate enzyme (YggS family)